MERKADRLVQEGVSSRPSHVAACSTRLAHRSTLYHAAQGKLTKGMSLSIENAQRVVDLKTKRLVNALSPIEAAYGSDEDLDDIGEPRLAQEPAAGPQPVAGLATAGNGQAAAPNLSPPPHLAEEVWSVGRPLPRTLQGQQLPAVPGGRRNQSPVPSPASKPADRSVAGPVPTSPISPAASGPPVQLPVLSVPRPAALADFPFNSRRGKPSAATCMLGC